MEEINLRFLSRKLLTCYQPDSLKTFLFDLDPEGAKSWISRFKAVSWHVSWPTGWRSHLDKKC